MSKPRYHVASIYVCIARLFSAHDNVPHDYKNTSADGHRLQKSLVTVFKLKHRHVSKLISCT